MVVIEIVGEVFSTNIPNMTPDLRGLPIEEMQKICQRIHQLLGEQLKKDYDGLKVAIDGYLGKQFKDSTINTELQEKTERRYFEGVLKRGGKKIENLNTIFMNACELQVKIEAAPVNGRVN